MLSRNHIFVFIFFVFITFPINLFSQTKENTVSDIILTKEQLVKKNAKTKHDIDSLKNVLKNLDANLKKHLKELYILKYGKKNGSRVANGQVWKGMTEQMLRDGWGNADTVNANSYKWGIYTQWTYGDITFFFKNGKLFEWEDKSKAKEGK